MSELRAFAKSKYTLREFDMIGLAPDEFDEVTAKRPDLRGVPVFYDVSNHRRIWPLNDLGYTANFFNGAAMLTIEEPIKIGD